MAQILDQKYSKQINLFEQSIKSEQTKKVYLVCLRKYLEFPSKLDTNTNNDKDVENHVIEFVISLKKKGMGFVAIRNYVAAVCKYYKMNDVMLNTNKINQYLPEFRKSKKDRAYRYDEIHRLMDVADERMRAIILILASSGMRVGAIPALKLRNLQRLDSYHSFYKIIVYEGYNEEYVTFCTPECATAIDEYLRMREQYGEKLTPESFLIREQFDLRDPFAISNCRLVRSNAISKKLIDLAERSVIRQREVLVEGSGKKSAEMRKDVPIAHGFRKFFTTQLVEADLKTELRWLLEGHKLKGNDSHYIRVTEKRLQEEYEKAIDLLTVNEANRLRKKVEILKIEKSRIDKLEAKIQKLERRHR
ncbi:MAG: tyrosine-type recombinase/integrase [Nitrososphaerota archaeon]